MLLLQKAESALTWFYVQSYLLVGNAASSSVGVKENAGTVI